jgi:hypothetical protein
MNITRAQLKETLRTIVKEESEYQSFFKSALEKAGKSIPDMSEEEKKAFFNKIDSAWDAKGEKNEALVGGQKELDIDGDGDIGADDLADLRAGKKKDESVTESTINESPSSEEIRIAMLAVSKQKKYRRVTTSAAVNDLMNSLEVIARDIKNGKIKDESVNESSKDDDYADELQKETEKVLKGKNIKGWKLYVDSRSGTFEFEKKGIDLVILATPMWDGNPNLPFNVIDGDGDNVNMIEKSIGNLLSFKPQYDLKKDISNYISVLTKTLSKVEQLYSKEYKVETTGKGPKINSTDENEEELVNNGGKQKSEKNYKDWKSTNNEATDGKKRFMFDFYNDSNERNTERETNFLATTVESAIKAAEHICKVTGYAYVEIYYKDLFLGSMKKQEGFKFVEGKGYSKFKSTN